MGRVFSADTECGIRQGGKYISKWRLAVSLLGKLNGRAISIEEERVAVNENEIGKGPRPGWISSGVLDERW